MILNEKLIIGIIIIVLFISYFENIREHSLKVAAFITILFFAFIAKEPWIFALAIALIGTTLASEKFIENIVAILRGNKFEVKPLNQDEKAEKAEKEVKSQSLGPIVIQSKSSASIKLDAQPNIETEKNIIKQYMLIEEKAIEYLKNNLNIPFQNQIKLINKKENKQYVFDGFAELQEKDIILEVKFIKEPLLNVIQEKLYKILDSVNSYQTLKAKPVELIIAIVTPDLSVQDKVKLIDKLNQDIQNKTKYMGIIVNFKILTFSDLDINDTE